jgi:membrane protein
MTAAATGSQPVQRINWRSPAAITKLAKELYGEFKQDRVTALAATFAYHTVFAIPALLILIVSLAALLNRATDVAVTENLREFINERAPAQTRDLLNVIVNNSIEKVGGGASFRVLLTALIALWSASAAVGAMIDSFNRAYDVEESRGWIKRKALTVGLTLLLALCINLAFALLVFGQRIGHWIAELAGLGSAFDLVWNILRWPIAIAAVTLILAILYWAGPDIDQSFRWISPGSIVATILWLVATAGFGIYLRFSNPGSAYGAVGSVLVLLFFLYVTGIVFLLGAELNALIGKRYDPDTIRDLATKPEVDDETQAEVQERLAERPAAEPTGTAATSPAPTNARGSAPRPVPARKSPSGLSGSAIAAAVPGLLMAAARTVNNLRKKRRAG